MSEEQAPPLPPEVDLEAFNRGRCFDEMELYPAELGLVVAAMVAELTGELATAEWLQNTVKVSNSNLALLKRRRWLIDDRMVDRKKVWRATDRAWRELGFAHLREQKAS